MSIRKVAAKLVASVSIAGTMMIAAAAQAEEGPVSIDASFRSDVFAVVDGGVDRGARYLDNLNITADVDLDRAVGWAGARFYGNLLNNLGGRPNDLAGAIQGVNNIEVANARFKLYEAWIEQALGEHVSLRAGLYDLNSEFYQTDASGLLISPPFGIGSELSATGPNGPSIFPSTALAARVAVTFSDVYVQAAVLNAKAGTIGDDQGIDMFGRDGALVIGEAGWTGAGKLAVGVWHYSKRQPFIDAPDAEPGHISQGAYLVAEHVLIEAEDGPRMSAFLRLGLSDGHTTPYEGGWQAGLLAEQIFAGRPESSLSLGAGVAYLSRNYRDSVAPDLMLGPAETILEVTYADEILPGLSLQPDIQYVINPAADPSVDNALVVGLRLQYDLNIY